SPTPRRARTNATMTWKLNQRIRGVKRTCSKSVIYRRGIHSSLVGQKFLPAPQGKIKKHRIGLIAICYKTSDAESRDSTSRKVIYWRSCHQGCFPQDFTATEKSPLRLPRETPLLLQRVKDRKSVV